MKYQINLIDKNIVHINKLLCYNLKRKHNKRIFRIKTIVERLMSNLRTVDIFILWMEKMIFNQINCG